MICFALVSITAFQSTLPHGSDNSNNATNRRMVLFQSTLPHGSDDKANDWAIRCVHISIHAPSRERHSCFLSWYNNINFNPRSLTGATRYFIFNSINCDISIHAPSRERPQKQADTAQRVGISIHAPSRERPAELERAPPMIDISIHAPSRERQLYCIYDRKAELIFQSTLPHGSDTIVHCFVTIADEFQSTLPHGSDRSGVDGWLTII